MRKFFSLIARNVVYLSIFLMMALIVTITAITFRNQNVMKQTNGHVAEAEMVIRNVEDLWTGVMLMDLGVRGYALTKKEGLLAPFNQAIKANPAYIDTLRRVIKKQNLEPEKLEQYIRLSNNYVETCRQMISMVDQDSLTGFVSILEEDRGLALWQSYYAFSSALIAHETQMKAEAQKSYRAAISSNTILQILLFILGVPSLYIIYYKIRKQASSTRTLLLDLEHNNRKYVFDPGTPVVEDHTAIMDSSISNLKKAAAFIDKITKGEYDAGWPGMDAKNTALNQYGLSGTLINMRDQMKRIKEEDENRIWVTEGLTSFTEIIRQYQEDVNGLCDQAVRFITKYMGAQQGGVFLLQEEEDRQYLEMVACYAFDKKKFMEKRVGLGEGLIGQAFLEGSTMFLKQVPQGYTHITSGLGQATPDCVLIVPMRYNEKMEGVVEIAGFHDWKEHERTFVGKATEYMAASLSSVRSTQKMKILLAQMQSQTEELHAQEEEMRQNMEEMAATNEEMKRNEAAYLKNEI